MLDCEETVEKANCLIFLKFTYSKIKYSQVPKGPKMGVSGFHMISLKSIVEKRQSAHYPNLLASSQYHLLLFYLPKGLLQILQVKQGSEITLNVPLNIYSIQLVGYYRSGGPDWFDVPGVPFPVGFCHRFHDCRFLGSQVGVFSNIIG